MQRQDISKLLNDFESSDDSIFYCLYFIANFTDDTTIFALNTLEKYIKEKWDKLEDIKVKKVYRNYFFDNINVRLGHLNDNLTDKNRQYLLTSINKLNYIIVLIASKDWPKAWPNLIGYLCEKAKNNFSYESENCMKILLLLSENINKNFEKIMTTKKNIELTAQMRAELNKILSVVKYFIVEKSNDFIEFIKSQSQNSNNINNINNNNNNGNKILAINILKQAIKLYEEFINWLNIENMLDNQIIKNILSILKLEICKNAIIECFGTLFRFRIDKIEGEFKEKIHEMMLDIYESFISIFHNNIIKRKNFVEQYKKISGTEPEKIMGFESFTILSENCLINFFTENFNFIKEKSIQSKEFLNTYNNSLLIGLFYILQFTDFKNEQIQSNAMEFWYFIVSELFTIKKPIKNSYNSNSSLNNNSLNSTNSTSIIEEKETLVEYLKNSDLYKLCFGQILNKLRELLCQKMTKPLELKIQLDENGDIISEINEFDESFNKNLQETKQNVLIFLTLIDPELTKNFIITKLHEYSKNNFTLSNLIKINSLSWSSGIIAGTMDDKTERDFVTLVCKLHFIMIKNAEGLSAEVLASDLMFVISKYIHFISKNDEFPFAVFKKLLELFEINSTYVKDFACETFLRLSVCDELLIQKKENTYDFIDFLIKNLKVYTKTLNKAQIMMVFEALSNLIGKVTDQTIKENFFRKLIQKPNESFIEIISKKNRNINYLNNINIIKEIKYFIATNERICYSLKNFYWLYGITIFKEIITIYIYYNEKLNEIIGDSYNHSIKRDTYKSINNTILKYFSSLVKNIGDANIIKRDMLFDYGKVLDIFSKTPETNKNPNVLLLFGTIVEALNSDYEVNYKIWDFFSKYIIKFIMDENNTFPDLTENFYKFTKSLVSNSTETFFYKYKAIPNNLIDVLNYGIKTTFPNIYELSLEILCILIEKIFQMNVTIEDKKAIILQFYSSYFKITIIVVFNNIVDGLHQNGIKTQIKILRILLNNLENETIFEKGRKNYFQKMIIELLPNITNNLTYNQIETFAMALFNYSNNENHFEIIIKDFLVSINSFIKKDEYVSQKEKVHYNNLSKRKELLKNLMPRAENKDNISIDNYRDDFYEL